MDLAIKGKLVPQDPNDEPASVLLERIRAEKQQMVKEGRLKVRDIKNDTIIFKGEDNANYQKQSGQFIGTKRSLEKQIDSLDVEDRHYDRKLSDLQDRLDKMYDNIEMQKAN